nr:hypothetical protein [uncultured Flavobacterium sp.]
MLDLFEIYALCGYGLQIRAIGANHAFGVVDADLPRYHAKDIHVKSRETFITFMVCNII